MNLRKIGSRMRPWIALIAAYAVALQMLLAITIAGQHAALAAIAPDLASAICLAGGTSKPEDPGRSPVAQAPCILCAVAASDPGPQCGAELVVPPRSFGTAYAAVSTPAATVLHHSSPRLSQGPPQIG